MNAIDRIPVVRHMPMFQSLFKAEERHFWFRARNDILASVIGPLEKMWQPGYRVLEVGCGTGNVLRMLEQVCRRGQVTGVDLHGEALSYARQRVECRLLQADVHDLPLTKRYQLIGMFDVLEHLPEDVSILRRLRDLLADDGRFLIAVPAHMWLWSTTDEIAGHYRRYSPARLRQVLEEAGFEVDFMTQFLAALTPIMWASRTLKEYFGKATEAEALRNGMEKQLSVVPVFNGIMYHLLSLERYFIGRNIRMPIGTSLLAVARPRTA